MARLGFVPVMTGIMIITALMWIVISTLSVINNTAPQRLESYITINQLERALAQANQQLAALEQKLLPNNATTATASTKLWTPNLPKTRSAVCSHLPQPIPSTLAIWRANLDRILNASKHANDDKYKLHDYTAELLHLVSQRGRIQKSVVGLPNDYTAVKRVMELVYERYQYLQHGGGAKVKEKVKILVMGGSLVVGVNCRKIVSDYNLGFPMPHRLCTWTHRLEYFLNNIWGADIFKVDKIALGGTNTATGFVLWESDFVPPEFKHPDILINAYSTNDMHILTVLEAQEGNTTLREKIMEMTQDFVRAVMKDGACAPLMLHMDDYLGNEQREVLATMQLSQAVQTLSSYYGFVAMSYANVVRDLVYGDTKETWFSPSGWYKGNTMVREIHPGMGMHIVSSWVAAYALLNLGLTYCTIEEWEIDSAVEVTTDKIPYQAIQGLPALRNTPVIPGKPKPIPKGLLPALTTFLDLNEVTALWRSAPVPNSDFCPLNEGKIGKCPFSWISGISNAGKNATYAKEIFEKHSINGSAWVVDDGGGKVGISPSKSKKMVLEFLLLKQPIHSITMFYMKSYGEKWSDSEIEVSAMVKKESMWNEVRRNSIFGFHAKHTSEVYTDRMEIDVNVGADFRVVIELVGGTTFKVMGLAICK